MTCNNSFQNEFREHSKHGYNFLLLPYRFTGLSLAIYSTLTAFLFATWTASVVCVAIVVSYREGDMIDSGIVARNSLNNDK